MRVDVYITCKSVEFTCTNENQAALINDLENIDQSIPIPNETNLVDLLLYGDEKFNDKTKSS